MRVVEKMLAAQAWGTEYWLQNTHRRVKCAWRLPVHLGGRDGIPLGKLASWAQGDALHNKERRVVKEENEHQL